MHLFLYAGSLTESTKPQGQFWFPHELRQAGTLSRKSTITSASPERRRLLNGRNISADCESSSGDSRGSVQVDFLDLILNNYYYCYIRYLASIRLVFH